MKTLLLLFLFPVLCIAQSGTLDTSFDPGAGANNWVISSSIQSDGKIIIGGDFTLYDGTARTRIARLNIDGSLDTSFNPGTGANSRVQTISIQSDGKIIIAGYFSSYNGTSRFGIARLNTDGSLDTSFDPGSGVNLPIFNTAIQNDGKIIFGGQFTLFDGTAINRIARLNTDGSLDTSFDPGSGANLPIETISIQNDGKIIIVGLFTSYNGTPRNRIARLNTDGSLDTFFDPGAGANNPIDTCVLQSDGKIIIGGQFTLFDGTAINRIARLNTDGSLDTTFDPGTGVNERVYKSFIQSDGKITISGFFTSYNGSSRNRIVRLNTDGSLDTSFDPGTAANDWISATSMQSDGNIIIGGSFNDYNGTPINRIARIISESTMSINEMETKKMSIFPNPFSNTSTLQSINLLNNATLTIFNLQGQAVKEIKNITGQTTIINRNNLPAGLYIISVSQDNQILMTDKLLITN